MSSARPVRSLSSRADDVHAFTRGTDPVALAREVREAHERFLATGQSAPQLRTVVEQSWRRSLSGGLDPERDLAPVELLDDELDDWRHAHPLAEAMPVIRRLLIDDAHDAGLLVALSDAAGRLLWVEGPSALRSQAEGIHFMAGAVWSEARAGTNAPGTALAIDAPVQIFAAEHLARPVTPWSCSAAPIHDPDTGAVLGALDLTGGHEVAAPHTLSIVRATVAAVESDLRVRRLTGTSRLTTAATLAPGQPVLRTLGRPSAVLESSAALSRLSLRHSELLVLLATHPEGLTGEQLSAELHRHDQAAVTVRAELSRLRATLAPLRLEPRPYRITPRLATDAEELRGLLGQGRVGAALDLYRGPLLPASDAPGVVRQRRLLHQDLRAALLATADPDLLLRFADTDHGRDDLAVWQAAAAALDPHSSRWPSVADHLGRLERELR